MRVCHRCLPASRGRASLRLALAGSLTCCLVASAVFADGTATHAIRGSLNAGRAIPYTASLDDLTLRKSVFDVFAPREKALSRSTLRTSLRHDLRPVVEDSGLRQSIDATIRSSDKLRAGLHDSNAAHYKVQAVRASLLPTITASTSFENARNHDEVLTSRSSTNGRRHSSSINVSMPLFSSGRIYYGIKSARHAALAKDYEYLALEKQTAFEGVAVYLDIYLANRRERAFRRNADALAGILTGVEKQYEAGFAGRTDVAIAAAELAQMRERVITERARLREAESDFANRTGLPAPVIKGAPRVHNLVPKSLEAALSAGLTNNAAILAAENTARADLYNSHSVRRQYLPQVTLDGGYDRTRYLDFDRKPENNWRVGVKLTVPLVDFTAAPTVLESREKALSSKYRARDTRRTMEQSIRSNWITYTSNRKNAAIALQRVKSLKIAATGVRKEFDAGLRPLSDVLRAQMDLTEARIRLTEYEVAYVSAGYLIAITGSNFRLASLSH